MGKNLLLVGKLRLWGDQLTLGRLIMNYLYLDEE